ncbi:unnamed protein product [Auanema sp. JU1783]|nr:unnamed protein product [Auanema sp. JU1783]
MNAPGMPGPGGMMGGPARPGANPNMGNTAAMQGQMRPNQMQQPPPYNRPAAGPGPQNVVPYGAQPNMMGHMGQGMQPPGVHPNMRNPANQQRPQMNNSNMNNSDPNLAHQLKQVEQRLRETRTQEEREQLFNDLKRTPYLFSAFLRTARNSDLQIGGAPYAPPQGMGGPYGQQRPPMYMQPMGQQGPQWHQQQYMQRPPQGNPAVGGKPFGQMQGRSPSMGMGSNSPMMTPGQQQMLPPPQGGQPPDQPFR